MKNKYLIIVLLLGLAGMFTMQSCIKDESPTPVVYKAAVPANPTPAEGDVVTLDGTSYTLTWEGTTTTNWDVYFGPYGSETLYKAGVTGNSITITGIEEGGEYGWYVETKDANGIVSSNITGPARDPWYFYINSAPTVPVLTAPVDGAVNVPVTTALKWTSEDAEHDAIKYDVYFGTSETPALVATGVSDATYSPTMNPTTKYYWKVVATDSHGYTATSPVYSFTTGEEAIAAFVGLYDCDEPGYKHYDVNFKKINSTTIECDNWWDSGWPVQFILDFAKKTATIKTYVNGTYTVNGFGTIDPATGKMVVPYTVTKSGAISDNNTHTYVKKTK